LDRDRIAYYVRAASADGSGIYVTSLTAPTERRFLVQTEAAGIVIRSPDDTLSLLWPRGGTLLAQTIDTSALRLVGEARPVADVGVSGATGHINASAAGRTLVLSAVNVVSQFTWFDRVGTPTAGLGEPDDYNTFDLSADGRRVIVSIERGGNTDLWIMDVERGGIPSRVATGARSLYPIWSPDRTEIAFGGGAVANVFRRSIEGGSDERRLTRAVRTLMPLDCRGTAHPSCSTKWDRRPGATC
jgi:hypothetical protein